MSAHPTPDHQARFELALEVLDGLSVGDALGESLSYGFYRAREHAETTLRLVPENRQRQLRQYFDELGIFGNAIGADPSAGGLELPEPSVGQPSTGDSGEGPALMLGDPSNLRLRDPGQKLELHLDD